MPVQEFVRLPQRRLRLLEFRDVYVMPEPSIGLPAQINGNEIPQAGAPIGQRDFFVSYRLSPADDLPNASDRLFAVLIPPTNQLDHLGRGDPHQRLRRNVQGKKLAERLVRKLHLIFITHQKDAAVEVGQMEYNRCRLSCMARSMRRRAVTS